MSFHRSQQKEPGDKNLPTLDCQGEEDKAVAVLHKKRSAEKNKTSKKTTLHSLELFSYTEEKTCCREKSKASSNQLSLHSVENIWKKTCIQTYR